MSRKRNSQEFTVRPLSSPELDGHFGEPKASKINEGAAALLAQMGGAETVESTRKIKAQRGVETHLAKLAVKVTLPETAETESVSVADFLSGVDEKFAAELGNDLESRPGVKLTKEALAAILGDAQWLVRIAEDCKRHADLEREHEMRTVAAVVGADESGEKAAA